MLSADVTTAQRWTSFLSGEGAGRAGATATSGAHPDAELDQARAGAFVCDLSGYGLIELAGADAAQFLHAQLSNDVLGLADDHAMRATYNSPKGRVLATLLLWRLGGSILAQLPVGLAEPIRKRLAMFILRAKVTAQLAHDRYVRIGLGGPRAGAIAASLGIPPIETALGMTRSLTIASAGRTIPIDLVIRLATDRYELLASAPDAAIALWEALTERGAGPAGVSAWRWLAVRSGIAEIEAATQDHFVAQMLNYELVGGVSFSKGCYPGQEIVARTQYRGEIKRRTFLVHVAGTREPLPAEPVFNRATPDQSIGAVVNAAPAPGGGYDALVCLHIDFIRQADLRIGSPEGATLTMLELPYSIADLT